MSKKTTVDFPDEYLQWRRLRRTVEASGGDPFGVFVELSKVIDGDPPLWQTLKRDDGEHFETFTEFVQDYSKGLGMSTDELKKLLAVKGRTEARGHLTVNPGLFEKVRNDVAGLLGEDVPAERPVGRPPQSKGATPTFEQKGADGILARLKRDDPDMARRVIDGELTANAAAREKGWRKPRVLLTNPQSVAKRIREHFTNEEIAQLKDLL